MNKIILAGFLILFSIAGFSQSALKASLYYKNGTVRTGYANLINTEVFKKINFRKKFKSTKVEKISFDSLKKIVYFNEKEKYEFHYIGVYRGAKKNKSTSPKWFKLEQEGYVSLFSTDMYISAGSMGNYSTIKFQDYYIKRKDESALTYYFSKGGIFSNFHFKNRSKRRFDDYPELIEKIKNKRYTIDDYKEVVRLYSEWLENNNNADN